MLATLLATAAVRRGIERQDRTTFDADVAAAQATMEKRVTAYLNLVRSTGQVFYLTPSPGPPTFDKYVQSLDLKNNYPGVRGLGASLRFPPSNPKLTAKVMAQLDAYYHGFHPWPDGKRREVNAVIDVFPLDRFVPNALGYDLHTEIECADAMDRARDSARVAITGKVALKLDRDDPTRPGFLVISPIYAFGKIPASQVERQRMLVGHAFAPFRMREGFSDLFPPQVANDIQFDVLDVSRKVTPPGGTELFRASGRTDSGSRITSPRFASNFQIPVGDREWRFDVIAGPAYRAGTGMVLTVLLMICGTAVSLLLFGIALYQIRVQRALEERQRSNETLNEQLRRAMRETHHRVKNNLQIIAAMIDMQAMDAGPAFKEELRRLSMHVTALATVHDILTDQAKATGETEHISARRILEKLLPMLEPLTMGRPLLRRLEDASLSTRQGTSLAIVTNELVSNAIKHGRGQIEISFAVNEGGASLDVTDDGPGFPPGFDFSQEANNGLQLVTSLSAWDLGGRVQFQNRPQGGAHVTVELVLHGAKN